MTRENNATNNQYILLFTESDARLRSGSKTRMRGLTPSVQKKMQENQLLRILRKVITRKMQRTLQGKSAHARLYPDKKENNDDFYSLDNGLG